MIMSQNERITGQIAVHKTSTKLIEFIDNLNVAPVTDYASIHAGIVRPCEQDGKRVYSTIRLVAQDYSIKGALSVRVSANISPAEVSYLASAIKYGAILGFKYESEKIYGKPNEHGYSSVTKLWVTRCKTSDTSFYKASQPWRVDIENGRGIKTADENGGTFCQPGCMGEQRLLANATSPGTYEKVKKVFLNLSDFEFFALMVAAERYVALWEYSHAPALIREGRTARDASWAAISKHQRNEQK
jgi:hypothetical protein